MAAVNFVAITKDDRYMSFGKMEGDASDKNIAYMLQDEAVGPFYRQEWQGMEETSPIISGGMDALRLPAFFENLGYSNEIFLDPKDKDKENIESRMNAFAAATRNSPTRK